MIKSKEFLKLKLAKMIRDKAREIGDDELARQSLATISKYLDENMERNRRLGRNLIGEIIPRR